MSTHEWDWPDRTRPVRRVVEGRVRRGVVVLDRRLLSHRLGRLLERGVVGALKIMLAIACTALVIGSLWFLSILFRVL